MVLDTDEFSVLGKLCYALDRLLMSEYHDCIQRAHRLASVKENHLAGKGDANMDFVTMEDLLIYLRWLVCHQHAMKHFNQYLRVRSQGEGVCLCLPVCLTLPVCLSLPASLCVCLCLRVST